MDGRFELTTNDPCSAVVALVRWAKGNRMTERLSNLSLIKTYKYGCKVNRSVLMLFPTSRSMFYALGFSLEECYSDAVRDG